MARKIKNSQDMLDAFYSSCIYLSNDAQKRTHPDANRGILLSLRELEFAAMITPAKTSPDGERTGEYFENHMAKYYPDRVKLLKDEKGEKYYFLTTRRK